MRNLFYVLALFLLPVITSAQVSGVVTSADGIVLEYVLVANQDTRQYTYTDEKGLFTLTAGDGDTVIFMLAGYKAQSIAAERLAKNSTVKLGKLSYSMEEIEVRPDLERYKEEHAEMLRTYNKTFADAERKPEVFGSNGLVVSGLISGLASRISGKRKRDQRFAEDFKRTENQKLVNIRYNPDVVMSAAKTSEDTAILFIRNNPMPVDFAKNASSLELLMWIRDEYSQWIKNGMDTTLYLKAD